MKAYKKAIAALITAILITAAGWLGVPPLVSRLAAPAIAELAADALPAPAASTATDAE